MREREVDVRPRGNRDEAELEGALEVLDRLAVPALAGGRKAERDVGAERDGLVCLCRRLGEDLLQL